MIGEIVSVNKEYYLIRDKVFHEDIDKYLVENYKTKYISLIIPKQIVEIINKDEYYITKYKIIPNSVKYFISFLYELKEYKDFPKDINLYTELYVTENLLNVIDEKYGINLSNVSNDKTILDKQLQICELFELVKKAVSEV